MSTMKKTPAKKAAKKKTSAFDEALTLPASKAVVAVKPMEATMQDQIEEEGEPWPNYSPFPEEEDTGPGFSPPNIAPVTDKVDEVVQGWDEPPKEEEPALGSGEPVDASEPLSGTGIPADAAKTVTNLIDACNYLYKLALIVKGPRGLKMHDEPILKRRVAAGRQLSSILAGLK